MYLPLPTPEEMAAWDNKSIVEYGLKPEILMENASREAFGLIKCRFKNLSGCSALVFAGSGNNGGDAFALARHLWNSDVKVMTLHSKLLKEYDGAAGYHLSLMLKLDIPNFHLSEYNLDFIKDVDIIVDGLLGTGFTGELRQDYVQWIKAINNVGARSYVISLDIPSGIDGVTGEPSPVAVRADDTVAFEEAKLGLLQPEARDHVGCLSIKKIGIPRKIKSDSPPKNYLLDVNILDRLTVPRRTMHKGEGGHVLVLGGSQALSGAAVLTCLGALRSGAGLVTLACPAELAGRIKGGWPEIMTLPLGEGMHWHRDMIVALQEHLSRFDAVVAGPGIGRDSSTMEFLSAYLDILHPRTLFDADALYFLSLEQSYLEKISQFREVLLTPHPGEMARFFGVTADQINQERTRYVQEFSFRYKINLVLKGAATLIAGSDRHFYVSPFATPNLAVGGSGDVLAGIIGSLMAQNLSTQDAASVGVYWHGLAGKELENTYPYRGNLAREIADILPQVLAGCKGRKREDKVFFFCSKTHTTRD